MSMHWTGDISEVCGVLHFQVFTRGRRTPVTTQSFPRGRPQDRHLWTWRVLSVPRLPFALSAIITRFASQRQSLQDLPCVYILICSIFFSIVFSMSDVVDKSASPRRSAFLSYFTNRYRCRLARSDNKKLWNNTGPMLWLLHGSVCAQVHLRVWTWLT